MSYAQHTHPMQPNYVFLEYPKHRHHAVHGWKEVKSLEQEERLTPDEDGWTDDLQDLKARQTISTDAVPSDPRYAAKPKRSHHKKVAPADKPVLALSTD